MRVQNRRLLKEAKSDQNIGWIHDWVKNIYDGVFDRVVYIWSLRTPEIWAQYSLMGLYDLAEQILLKQALETFHTKWKETYPYRNKNPHVQSQRIKNLFGRVPRNGSVDHLPDATGSRDSTVLPASGEGSDS